VYNSNLTYAPIAKLIIGCY